MPGLYTGLNLPKAKPLHTLKADTLKNTILC